MHLKSLGAIVARTLSYKSCDFEICDGVSDDKVREVYNRATELWTDLHCQLNDRVAVLKAKEEISSEIAEINSNNGTLSSAHRFHIELHADSDDESLSSDEEDEAAAEQRRVTR